PKPPLDDEVESDPCLGDDESFAEYADILLAGAVYNQVAAFVWNHAQVFEIVEPGPGSAVECRIILLEVAHPAHELDYLVKRAIFQISVWVGSPDDGLGL